MPSIMSRAELRSLPVLQRPNYPDGAALDSMIGAVEKLPPLVFAGRCDDLQARLAEVAEERAFLLQGGDCAESFEVVMAQHIKDKLLVQLSMAVVMAYATQVPVVKIGRTAGQYAKPRSKPTETRGETTLPNYRGDAINGFDFTEQARIHSPERLIRLYSASTAALNLVRAFATGGLVDLHGVHTWNRDFVSNPEVGAAYGELTVEIDRTLTFMVVYGVDNRALSIIDFYASHEAPLLEYERAITRVDSHSQQVYGCSGHILRIGERTRQLDGARVELLWRVRNPLGIRLGPTTTPRQTIKLANHLDPDRGPDQITFITRMGTDRVYEVFPRVIEGMEETGRRVAWVYDPVHSNTFETANGYEARSFDDVVEEVRGFFGAHDSLGTWPGDLHVELISDDVTECVDGALKLEEAGLADHYGTVCNPRLNHNQSLELAFTIATRLRKGRRGRRNPVLDFRAKELRRLPSIFLSAPVVGRRSPGPA